MKSMYPLAAKHMKAAMHKKNTPKPVRKAIKKSSAGTRRMIKESVEAGHITRSEGKKTYREIKPRKKEIFKRHMEKHK